MVAVADTSWSYSGLKVSSSSVGVCDGITVSFDVHNTGAVTSDEVAQVYLGWPDGAGDTNFPELRQFARVSVAAHGVQHVALHLPASARAVVRDDGVRVVRAGEFTIYAGGGQPLVAERFRTSNILSAHLTVSGAEHEADSC